MSVQPNYIHEADAPAYPRGPRRRNALGGLGLLLGLIALALSESLGASLLVACLSFGSAIPALNLDRRPRGVAVSAIAVAALAVFVAVVHAFSK